MSIAGDVDFVLLPRPALNANDVRMAGDVSDDFIAAKRLSARLAFLPLLRGELEFRELVLREPEARVTRSKEGVVDFLNMSSAPQAEQTAAAPSAAEAFTLNVGRLLVDGGTMIFQDIANGTTLNVEGIDLTVLARATAPVSVVGDATVAKVPLTIDAAVGRAGTGGSRTISVNLKLPEADTTVRFSGTLADAADGWSMNGDLNIAGDSSAGLLTALGALDAGALLPQALQKPFSIAAKIHGNPETFAADPLTLDIGGTSAKGTVNWRALAPPQLDVKIETGTVDVQAWHFAEMQSPGFAPFNFVKPAHAAEAVSADARFAPFKNLAATFDVRMPVLSYHAQTLRDGVIAASLSQGELTVSEASVALPGATRAKAFGIVRFDDSAVFEGAMEVETGDLLGMLVWLGINPDATQTSPGRLSNASFRAALQGTPAQFTLADITATIDTSTLTGRMSWARAPRPTLDLDLAVNTLNVDAYLPLLKSTNAPSPAGAAHAAGYGVTPVFASFSGLSDFDADVRVQIDALTMGGIANGKVGLDLGLKDSTLNIHTASFENVGGVTAWFSGGIGGFGVTPRFDDLQFDFSAADIARTGRAFGFDVPQPLRSLTPVALTGTIKGSLAQANIAATLKAADLTVHADGEALTLDQQPHLSLNVDASQASYAALMKAAGTAWPFNMPDPGPVKLTAHVTHEKSGTKIESIALRIGDNTLAGSLQIARAQKQPEITGVLTNIAIAGDRLWPKAPPSFVALTPVSTARPALRAPAVKPPPWSDEPFDWGVLKDWHGNIQLSGSAFSLRGVQVRDFGANLVIADNAAEISGWNGKVFGTPGQIYLRVAAAPVPLIQGEIAFLDGDLAAVAGAVNGGDSGPGGIKPSGRVDFAGSFRAQGQSPAALVAGLSGSGNVKITASETGSGIISGLLGAVAAASRLEKGTVTLESRVSATDGKIKIEDATVASKSYGGAFTGTIDLPRWLVDLSGKLRLERATGDTPRPATVPITVKGALDLPNIMLLPPS